MPLGLDLKSLIVGVVLAWFVFPYVMGMLNKNKGAPASANV